MFGTFQIAVGGTQAVSSEVYGALTSTASGTFSPSGASPASTSGAGFSHLVSAVFFAASLSTSPPGSSGSACNSPAVTTGTTKLGSLATTHTGLQHPNRRMIRGMKNKTKKAPHRSVKMRVKKKVGEERLVRLFSNVF